MIIYGTTSWTSQGEGGVFNCPQCACQQHYKLQIAKRFFTLYFIPLIPMGEIGRYVECAQCAGTYSEEILSYDPAKEEAETQTQALRIVVMYMTMFNRTTQADVAACQAACSELLGVELPPELLQREVSMAAEAQDPGNFVRGASAEFSVEGKVLILKAAKRVSEADGNHSPADRDSLHQFGLTMGIAAPQVDAILEALEINS